VRPLLGPAGRAALRALARGRPLVALDLDGTLSPIVGDRHAARPRPETLRLLRAVAERYPTVVLTGRARADAASRLPGVALREVIGNHGAERARPGAAARAWRAQARRWAGALAEAARGLPGGEIEDKGLTVTAHYRHAAQPRAARARLVRAARALPDARVLGGKRVVSVLPRDAPHKGHALAAAAARQGADGVLFVGDDDTDEEAFGHPIAVPAVMVRVGPARRSRAPWRLDGQAEVDKLLRLLAGLRPAAAPAGPPVGRDEGGGREALPTVLAFLRALWELDHALGSRSKRMHADLGVTGPQRLVVRTLGLRPGASPAELARLLHLHPASVTRLVAGLARRGLVTRSPDPRDSRRLHLGLTARGRRLGAARAGTVEAEVAEVLRRHGPAEVAGAQALLAELARALHPAPRRR
jgi:trehalose 6-phosphate phosphatase